MIQRSAFLTLLVLSAACNGGSTIGSLAPPQSLQLSASSCLTSTCIYALAGSFWNSEIAIFADNARGNVRPLAVIGGKKTEMGRIGQGVAVDENHVVYATDAADDAVRVYAAGSYGNVKPAYSIDGSQTDLNVPQALAIDDDNNLYVANSDGGSNDPSITVYAAGAKGNAAPIQIISGPSTGLMNPSGVAVDSSHDVYVANPGNSDGGTVTVYAAHANGDEAPIQTISGPNTQLSVPTGIAVDSSKNIYVSNTTGRYGRGFYGRITVYAAGSNGNVAPIQTISGDETKLSYPWGLALNSSRDIYVAAGAPSTVLVFAAGANGNVKPMQTIKGRKTTFGKLSEGWSIAIR